MVSNIPFYDFGSFWSMAVNTVDILQFLSFILDSERQVEIFS